MPIQSGNMGFPLSNLCEGSREENAIVPHLIVFVTKPWCQTHADYILCYMKRSPAVPIACPVVCILLHKALSCTAVHGAKTLFFATMLPIFWAQMPFVSMPNSAHILKAT